MQEQIARMLYRFDWELQFLLWLNKQFLLLLLLVSVSALMVVVTLMNFPELFDIYPAVNSACGTQPTSIECGQNLNMFVCVNQVLLLQLFLHLNLMECLIRGFAQWSSDLLTVWIKITWATETILIFIEPELLFWKHLEIHLLWKMLSIIDSMVKRIPYDGICISKIMCIK